MSNRIQGGAWLGGVLFAAALLSAGCSPEPPPPPAGPKQAFYRGVGFWFQDLASRFHKAVNPAGKPRRYELVRQPDFDALPFEFYQDLAGTLSSVYPMTELSFGARASEMLQPLDVTVCNTGWVEEFARNGWLAPYDEAAVGPMLREAGVEPIRAVGPGDDPKAPRIYGIPISRTADVMFYRKSYFNSADEARQTWVSLFQAGVRDDKSAGLPLATIETDGQEFYRYFLPLVWSLEPDWPRQTNGTFVVDTPAARQVLDALNRSMQIKTMATAATRMEFLVEWKQHVRRFTNVPVMGKEGAGVSSAWMLSLWAQRILLTPWGPPAPLEDIGILPLSIAADGTAPGYSLLGGKCIICSRQIASEDPAARAAREVAQELVRYLLSDAGQRTLFFDQFEIPARRGLLQSLTDQEVAAVFGSRREWCSYEEYLTEVRAGSRQMDERSAQLGRQTLAIMREMESLANDPARLKLRPNPFSINRCALIDGFVHTVLAPTAHAPGEPLPGLPETAAVVEPGAPAKEALAGLQVTLEAEQRFMVPRNSAPVPGKATSP